MPWLRAAQLSTSDLCPRRNGLCHRGRWSLQCPGVCAGGLLVGLQALTTPAFQADPSSLGSGWVWGRRGLPTHSSPLLKSPSLHPVLTFTGVKRMLLVSMADGLWHPPRARERQLKSLHTAPVFSYIVTERGSPLSLYIYKCISHIHFIKMQ